MSTNSVASAAELEVIKQWLKKTAGLSGSIEVESFFFLVINLLHSTRSQSVADYLQQVAYSFRGLREQKPPSQADKDVITVKRDHK